MCVFILRSFLFSSRGGRAWALISGFKTDRADFTDWMSFLPSNLAEEISSYPEALSKNT